jgi:hypothetical protein
MNHGNTLAWLLAMCLFFAVSELSAGTDYKGAIGNGTGEEEKGTFCFLPILESAAGMEAALEAQCTIDRK